MATVRKRILPDRRLERRQQIENLRAAALALIKSKQQWTTVSGIKCPAYEDDDLKILLHTPFQAFPKQMPALPAHYSDQQKFFAVSLFQNFEQHTSGLDIWSGGKKVLNIGWTGDGEINVVSFKRGDWERKLV
jgi:hypothetical protein